MILPDVNILIYAFRKDAPQHVICRPWLEAVILGDAQFGISRLVLSVHLLQQSVVAEVDADSVEPQ